MSRNAMQGLDLLGLPPEVQAKIRQRLAAMTPEVQAKWASAGAPLLAKLVNGLAEAGGAKVPPPLPGSADAGGASRTQAPRYEPSAPVNAARRTPQGHYNDTVRPGDAPGTAAWILIAGAALGVAAYLLF